MYFSFFVAPSLAVFDGARAFNSDISKWNTGAVTTMYMSKCRFALLCFFDNSHTVCYCFCLWNGTFVVLVVLFFSLFVVPLFAVFRSAMVFNSDVSKWNTGSVTTMLSSKRVLVCCVF